MTLTLANPIGWAFGELLTSAQMNHLQNEIVKALDGAGGGGPYSPAAALILAGAGLRLQGAQHQVTGTLSVMNLATLRVASGGVANVESGGGLNVQAGGALDVDGAADFSDPITLSGNGHVRKRIHSHIADANLSVGVNTADVVRIEGSGTSALSADRTLTLLPTDAATGSQILLFTEHTAFAMTGVPFGSLKSASGHKVWSLLTWIGGGWVESAYYGVP